MCCLDWEQQVLAIHETWGWLIRNPMQEAALHMLTRYWHPAKPAPKGHVTITGQLGHLEAVSLCLRACALSWC